jgi:hypothetical protein
MSLVYLIRVRTRARLLTLCGSPEVTFAFADVPLSYPRKSVVLGVFKTVLASE